MPLLNSQTKLSASKKEIDQEQEESESLFWKALGLAGRPSGVVAGLGKELVDLKQGKPFNPIDAITGNLSGRRQDTWGENLRQAGSQDSLLTSGVGMGLDMVLDPLNLVGGLGAAAKAGKLGKTALKATQTGAKVMDKVHDAQNLAKAGKLIDDSSTLGNIANKIATETAQGAKALRSIGSNYAGLTPKQQAVVQLYDAKLHSFDDLVRNEAVEKLKKIPAGQFDKRQSQIIEDAVKSYQDKIKIAQNELKATSGRVKSSDDFLAALDSRLNPKFDDAKRWNIPYASEGDRIWKKSKTRWNPKFYINNELGNIQQALQEASSQGMKGYGDVARSFAAKYGIGSDDIGKLGKKELEELAKERGVRTSVTSVYRGQETAGKGNLRKNLTELAFEMNPKSSKVKSWISPKLNKAQDFVEGGSRQATFNALLRQELRNAGIANPSKLQLKELADKAALRTTQALFDYEDVTPFVKSVRSFPLINMPFATWAVKNIPRQVEQGIKNPQFLAKYANANKTLNVDELPAYMKDRFNIPIFNDGESTTTLNPAPPAADLNNLGLEFLEGISPAGEVALELYANRDNFTGKPLADKQAGIVDKLLAPQELNKSEAKYIETLGMIPGIDSLLDLSTNPRTGKTQAAYGAKRIANELPILPQLSNIIQSVVNPQELSNTLPLSPVLPASRRSNQAIKKSKEFDRKEAAERVVGRKATNKKKGKRESSSEKYKRWIKEYGKD